jgi:hypothetical protein
LILLITGRGIINMRLTVRRLMIPLSPVMVMLNPEPTQDAICPIAHGPAACNRDSWP